MKSSDATTQQPVDAPPQKAQRNSDGNAPPPVTTAPDSHRDPSEKVGAPPAKKRGAGSAPPSTQTDAPVKNGSASPGTSAASVVVAPSGAVTATSSTNSTGKDSNPSSAAAASGPVGGVRLSWLMSMMPDATAARMSQQPTAGAATTPGTSTNQPGGTGKASHQDESGETGKNSKSGDTGHGGKESQIDGAALAKAAANDVSAQDPTKVLAKVAATDANAQGPTKALANKAPGAAADSLPAADAKPEAANSKTATAQDETQLQNAAQSLESAGLTLLSKTTSADGGALPTVFQAKGNPTVSAASGAGATASSAIAHVAAAERVTQTAAKDSPGGSSGAAQPAARSDGPAAVKPPSASTSDGSKNSSPQDSSGKLASPPQPAASAAAASSAGAATSAINTSQTAANGVSMAQNQVPASGSPLVHNGASTQPNTPANAGDKVAAAMDSPVNAPQPAVSAASLVQAQGRSEMRVAVQTENMGPLQLHAVLEGGRVGASISVVSHEAHTLLNNELPALQQVLTDHNLRIDHLTVVNSPMSSGAGAGGRHNFQSGNFDHPQGRDTRWYSPIPPVAAGGSDALQPAEIRGRLSVRA